MNDSAIEAGHLQVADDGGIRRIELRRPDKVNALNTGMMSGIARAAHAAVGAGAGLVVISGQGARGFCAGADIEEFARGEEHLRAQEHALRDLIFALATLPLPLVVLAHGRTLGAGGILTSLADITIAADDLAFGFPEIRFNMYPAIVHAVLMQKVPGPIASQLCSTGRLLNASEAQAFGLVSEVLPAAGFVAAAAARIRFLAERRIALGIGKRAAQMTHPVELLRTRFAALAPLMAENYSRPGVRATIQDYLAIPKS